MLKIHFVDVNLLLAYLVRESHMSSPSSPGYLPQYLLGGNSPAASVCATFFFSLIDFLVFHIDIEFWIEDYFYKELFSFIQLTI